MPSAKACQLVILIVVAGCATQPDKDHGAASANTAGTDVQCQTQHVTGALIAKRVCTTKAQRDAAQDGVEDTRDAAMKSVTARPGQ
jgi:hypothetical protein